MKIVEARMMNLDHWTEVRWEMCLPFHEYDFMVIKSYYLHVPDCFTFQIMCQQACIGKILHGISLQEQVKARTVTVHLTKIIQHLLKDDIFLIKTITIW